MKRLLIIFLLLALAVSGSQSQLVRGAGRAVRAGKEAVSTSRNLMRNLEQQSRRAEQAARGAAAANRVKLKPSGIRIVPVPNVDNDDQNQKNQGGNTRVRPIKSKLVNVTPLPKIKTLSEYEDERIAAMYDSIKTLVNKGAYLGWPYDLFKIADYAMRHDDEQFAIVCLEQVNTDRVTPKYLEFIGRRYSSLTPFMPEISRAVAITAYCKMVEAKISYGSLTADFEEETNYGNYWVDPASKKVMAAKGNGRAESYGEATGWSNGNANYSKTNSRYNSANIEENHFCIRLTPSNGDLKLEIKLYATYCQGPTPMFYQSSNWVSHGVTLSKW